MKTPVRRATHGLPFKPPLPRRLVNQNACRRNAYARWHSTSGASTLVGKAFALGLETMAIRLPLEWWLGRDG